VARYDLIFPGPFACRPRFGFEAFTTSRRCPPDLGRGSVRTFDDLFAIDYLALPLTLFSRGFRRFAAEDARRVDAARIAPARSFE